MGYRLTNDMLNRIGQNVFTAFKLIVLMKADNSGVQPQCQEALRLDQLTNLLLPTYDNLALR